MDSVYFNAYNACDMNKQAAIRIWKEINSSATDVHDFIKNEFKKLLENIFLPEWMDSNIDFTSPPSTSYIINEMKKIVNS